jgi:UDP-2,3-diacylglucosamine hydrolase
MRDVFLADAHLRHPDDANYQRLLQFLQEQQGQIRTLYLLGDIFEFWVGYRHVVFAPYVPLLESLRRLRAAGAEIVYVEGNHDFHMGSYFRDVLGCRVLPDGGAIELGGRRVYLGHGDLANADDRGYRLLRRLLRSPVLRGMISLLPPDWTWGIAQWASRRSRRGGADRQRRWAPEAILLQHARQRFEEGYQVVITGHFHYPLLRVNLQGTLLALGDWIEQYSFAVFENDAFHLDSY